MGSPSSFTPANGPRQAAERNVCAASGALLRRRARFDQLEHELSLAIDQILVCVEVYRELKASRNQRRRARGKSQ
jgi:hypothetical protein